MCVYLSIPVRFHWFCDFYQSNTSTTTHRFSLRLSFHYTLQQTSKEFYEIFLSVSPDFYIPMTVAHFRLSPLLFHLNKFPSVGYLRFLQIYL